MIGSTSSDKYKNSQDISMQQQAQIQDALPLILVYYKFRGQLQPIRNLYCFLQLPFIEIHLDYFEEQKQHLSPMILRHIFRFNILKKQLPALIHGNFLVEGLFSIICYTCKRFKRQGLFGSSIRMRARQQQIFQNYLLKQPQSMIELFTLSDKVASCQNDSEINFITSQLYQKLMSSSKYIKEICQYLDQQPQVGYVFGEITLIDFFFFETCQYMNGLFGREDRVNTKELAAWEHKASHRLDKPNSYYIDIMKKYKERMKLQPWYVKHKDYLQSFSIINKTITPERVQGLRKIWLGNPKSVA